MECNHIIGFSTPRFGNDRLIYHTDYVNDVKWRGSVFWYCPRCSKKLWEWKKMYDKKIGNYKLKVYIG